MRVQDIEALFEKLHGKYGQDPLELWEKQAAAPLLSKGGADEVSAYGGMEATLMNAAGAALRSRQLRHHATLLQVSGARTITLFRPQDTRAMYPYPSTHPAHPQSQIANVSQVYSKDHPLRKNFDRQAHDQSPQQVDFRDEFCIKNDEFWIKNDEFRIKNDEFCIQNEVSERLLMVAAE